MMDDRLGMVFLLDDRTEYDASNEALDGAQAEPAPGERERYGRVKVRAKASGCAQGHAEQAAEAEASGKGLRPHQHFVCGEEYGNQEDGDCAYQHGVHLRKWAPDARARFVKWLKKQTMRPGIEERPCYKDSHAGKK